MPGTRYVVWWKRDYDTEEFKPRGLFEIAVSGKVTPFDPTGHQEKFILDREWPIAQGAAQDNPYAHRLVEVTEAEASVIRMELTVAHSQERGLGDIRTGDYIFLNAGEEGLGEFVAYGRVLERLDEDYHFVLILGVNLSSHSPFDYAKIHETDGRTIGREVESASELEPGKIYAAYSDYLIPETIKFIRGIRKRGRSPGWVHIPDEAIDQKSMKAGGARRSRNT